MADPPTSHPLRRRWADAFPVAVLGMCASMLVIAGVWLAVDRPPPSAASALDGVAEVEREGGIRFGQQDADPNIGVGDLLASTAASMGGVTSVEFELDRTEAPIFIDQFQSIELNRLIGQFEAPANAQAAIDVTIQDSSKTRIGAIAFEREVWVSNPVTGDFETLPPGYDIDPSKFFDPRGGWQPLIENLSATELVGIDRRDGNEAYRVTGNARAADVTNITVGLIRDQDVEVEMWIDPATSLVTHLDFTTTFGNDRSRWQLDLRDYGADFTISPPPAAG